MPGPRMRLGQHLDLKAGGAERSWMVSCTQDCERAQPCRGWSAGFEERGLRHVWGRLRDHQKLLLVLDGTPGLGVLRIVRAHRDLLEACL